MLWEGILSLGEKRMSQVHPKLQALLSASQLKHRLDNGIVRMIFDHGNGRSQMVLIDNDADDIGPYSDFDVMSIVCPSAKVTGAIALKLLQIAGEKKYGGFMIRGDALFWKADCPAMASPDYFDTLVRLVAIDADSFEQVLTGKDDH